MDPYKVLGINENATEAEIKEAYRALARKYHPDKYANNPLADLAEEKMREVNEAYDMLMKGNSGGNSYGGSGSANFSQIRQDIDMGKLDSATAGLQRMSIRNAEWYFLTGVVAARRGWYDEAMRNLQTAVNMDPTNQEYQMHYQSLANQGNIFRNRAQGRGYTSTNDDLLCQALQCYICADCCCDCI
ncbi:MAG: J domain-containing protein [Bacillota bacterium]|nr:J domain-containing protein [Bacillota bacterium]